MFQCQDHPSALAGSPVRDPDQPFDLSTTIPGVYGCLLYVLTGRIMAVHDGLVRNNICNGSRWHWY